MTSQVLRDIVHEVIDTKRAVLMTDEYKGYASMSKTLPRFTINHFCKELRRGYINTNTIESFWTVLKQAYIGHYHHYGKGYAGSYIGQFATVKSNPYLKLDNPVGTVVCIKRSWGQVTFILIHVKSLCSCLCTEYLRNCTGRMKPIVSAILSATPIEGSTAVFDYTRKAVTYYYPLRNRIIER